MCCEGQNDVCTSPVVVPVSSVEEVSAVFSEKKQFKKFPLKSDRHIGTSNSIS